MKNRALFRGWAIVTAMAIGLSFSLAACTPTDESDAPVTEATAESESAEVESAEAEPTETAAESTEPELQNMFEATEGRWGSREIEITDVAMLDKTGEAAHVFHSGDPMNVRVSVVAHQHISDFVFGIGLFNADGVCCYGTNTYLEEMTPVAIEGRVEATFAVDRLDLVEGTYKLDVAVHKRDGYPYDYHRLLYTFRVKSRTHDAGIYRPPHKWTFTGAVSFSSEIDKLG